MKNITVSVSDDVYRAARIAAAERGTSVSAIVAEHLRSLSDGGDSAAELLEVIHGIRAKHPGIRAGDRLTREEVHDRERARAEAEASR